MATLFENIFGGGSNDAYWYALAQQQVAEANAAAEAAAQQQAAAAAAAQQQTGANIATASGAVPAAGSTFDPAPYRGIVDAGFSQFTPEWYANQYQAAYAPYQSGVQGQYDTARDQLTAGLAQQGGNTTQNAALFQSLDALRDQELGRGQTAAQGFQTSLTGDVNTSRNNLYNSIGAGENNSTLGARTQTEANRILGTQAPASTLGSDVFGSIVAPYANATSPNAPAMSFGAAQNGGELNLAGGATGPAASTQVVGQRRRGR